MAKSQRRDGDGTLIRNEGGCSNILMQTIAGLVFLIILTVVCHPIQSTREMIGWWRETR